MDTITIRIPDDMLEWVRAEAERRRVPVSIIIRELILEAMRKGREG